MSPIEETLSKFDFCNKELLNAFVYILALRTFVGEGSVCYLKFRIVFCQKFSSLYQPCFDFFFQFTSPQHMTAMYNLPF